MIVSASSDRQTRTAAQRKVEHRRLPRARANWYFLCVRAVNELGAEFNEKIFKRQHFIVPHIIQCMKAINNVQPK